MAEKLRKQGAEVLELPAIRTERIRENQRMRGRPWNIWSGIPGSLYQPRRGPGVYGGSGGNGTDLRKLAHVKIAAIGEGTKKALRERGLLADLIPEVYDGASLGEALAGVCGEKDRILLPRAKAGSQEILEKLSGIRVDDIPTYETYSETQDYVDEASLFGPGGVDCAVFTSASTVKGFVEATPGLDYSKVTAACIGRQTRAAAGRPRA